MRDNVVQVDFSGVVFDFIRKAIQDKGLRADVNYVYRHYERNGLSRHDIAPYIKNYLRRNGLSDQ